MVDDLSIQPFLRTEMTKEGLSHFSPHSRKYFAKSKICRFQKSRRVLLSDFDTEAKIALFVWRYYGAGDFYLMGRSHGKNQKKNKPVRLCRIVVHDLGNEEYSYQISQIWRLKQRYKWFWKGSQ